MNIIAAISINSLSFNDSLVAHIGSRIYRIAITALEALLGNTLVPSYSGKRLYQLVDTYRQSKNDRNSYDQARKDYVNSILTALQGERDPIEKMKKARTLLNTNIAGLFILQKQHKHSLSQHVAFELLPSLINAVGEKMANKSILALHELDSMGTQEHGTLNKYASIYTDIALQKFDLDSAIKALQSLNIGISKDILINELLLSRDRHFSKAAKSKITAILQDKHYIDIKLQKKLQILHLLDSRDQTKKPDETVLRSELETRRNHQLEALNHKGPSMFFESNVTIDGEDEFFTVEESLETANTESLKETLYSDIPIGIINTQQNCWYNSALQILCAAPLCFDIAKKRDTFSKKLSELFKSFDLYQTTYNHNSDIRVFSHPVKYGMREELIDELFEENPQLLEEVRSYREKSREELLNIDKHLPNIRKEIHTNINKEFRKAGSHQEDSKQFLILLLEKLEIDVARRPLIPGEDINTVKSSFNSKYIVIDKAASHQVDLEALFNETNYLPIGIIFHTGTNENGHYFTALRKHDSWYLCNDIQVTKISKKTLENLLQRNESLIIASSVIEPEKPIQST